MLFLQISSTYCAVITLQSEDVQNGYLSDDVKWRIAALS